MPTWFSFVGLLLLFSPVADAQQTVIFGVDADTMVRTDVDSRRNDNYGCDRVLQLGTSRGGGGIPFGGPDAMRSLLHFDLSSVPAGFVSSAILEVSVWGFANGTGTSVFNASVHRVIDSASRTPWIEGNGTFSGIPPGSSCTDGDSAWGVSWAAVDANNQAQPDFDAAVEATALIRQGVNQQGDVIQWDVTSLVRSWLEGTTPNFGLLLRDVTSDGTFREVFLVSKELQTLYPSVLPQLPGPRLVLSIAPYLNCQGFEPPLNSGPVTVKKNRALPFKARLLGEDGVPASDSTLVASPVIQVLFTPLSGGVPIDVSSDAVPVGLGTEGNEFVFTPDEKWQFNLKTENYSAPGTYQVTMVSGDLTEYVIEPACGATFVIE
jgi:hypothetical protein